MSKKVVIVLAGIAAVAVYLTIKEEGADQAFGGLLAPIETVREDDRRVQSVDVITGNSIPQTTQTDYKKMVDRVRERTNAAMDKSVERSSR